ncbi:RIO1 family regulatory kinase/ATPase [Hyalangium rubrum]|uniref:non-specific serine/threonine protein kinase n=1 Tax=Hyalangium rubrum TaxID=3103134 RepID=A0ABU5H2B0_9BACT|nr:RIO1 family regulatory kinase/ATPase [Hyalangium sp. s54d21]MDY7227597.1 RIO1 family regulatory kinase/ATPase [Hyalangium sp. s54d21]
MHEALEVLLADGVIDEVVARLKSGKEADVYIATHGDQYVAAKIYKERTQRNFKNNSGYKEGRLVRNSRTRRAMEKGSRFGQEAAEDAWKTAESEALSKLYTAGVRVPAPVMFYEGVLLMELVVDVEGQPAARLIDGLFTPESANEYYRDLRQQAVKMLCCDIIHGDLSAYNILLGANGPTIIDFPQIVSASANSRAEFFFKRDLDNLRLFFADQDRSLLGRAGDAAEIWRAYVRRELTPDFEPTGRAVPETKGQRGGERHGGRPQRPEGAPRHGESHGHGGSPRHTGEHGGRQGAHRHGEQQNPPGGSRHRESQGRHGGPRHGEQQRQSGTPRHAEQQGQSGTPRHAEQQGHPSAAHHGERQGHPAASHSGEPRGHGGASRHGEQRHRGAPRNGESRGPRGMPRHGEARGQGGAPHQGEPHGPPAAQRHGDAQGHRGGPRQGEAQGHRGGPRHGESQGHRGPPRQSEAQGHRGARPQRPGTPGRRGASPAVSYVSRLGGTPSQGPGEGT